MAFDDTGNRFLFHPADTSCTDLAHFFDDLPECREKSLAIANLEQAMFWANAAVARQAAAGLMIKMIWFARGRWSSASGRWFIRDRIYRGGRWTPFVRVRRRRYAADTEDVA